MQDEKRYNLSLLAYHRLAEGEINGKFVSVDTMAAMAVEYPNSVEEQWAL